MQRAPRHDRSGRAVPRDPQHDLQVEPQRAPRFPEAVDEAERAGLRDVPERARLDLGAGAMRLRGPWIGRYPQNRRLWEVRWRLQRDDGRTLDRSRADFERKGQAEVFAENLRKAEL